MSGFTPLYQLSIVVNSIFSQSPFDCIIMFIKFNISTCFLNRVSTISGIHPHKILLKCSVSSPMFNTSTSERLFVKANAIKSGIVGLQWFISNLSILQEPHIFTIPHTKLQTEKRWSLCLSKPHTKPGITLFRFYSRYTLIFMYLFLSIVCHRPYEL